MFSLKSMVTTAVFTAMLCIVAPISVPLPAFVPLSLATLGVYVTSALLGGKRGAIATAVYVLLGAVGVPVFSGYQGGAGVLLGMTGGYIVGYILLALITGAVSQNFAEKRWTMPLGMALGTVVLYAFGTAWYMAFTWCDLKTAIMGCVVPFLVTDIIKIAIATAICIPLKARLAKLIEKSKGL